FFSSLKFGNTSSLTPWSLRFDSFCAPSVHFTIETGDDATHLSFEVRASRVVTGHLNRFLAECVRNGPFVCSGFTQDHRDGVTEAVQGEARRNEAPLFKRDAHLPP